MTKQTEDEGAKPLVKGALYGGERPLADLLRTQCDQCYCQSIVPKYFQDLKGETLCPRCYPARTNRSLFWSYLYLLGAAVFWAALVGNGEGGFAIFFVVNVALAFLLLHLLILPHELLHAGTAWLLGGQVFAIQIGLGLQVWKVRWQGVIFSLHRYLLMGFCAFGFPDRRWIRLRFALATLMPLLGHLLLAIWLWPHLRWGTVWSTLAWPEMLMIVNGFLLVANLFPWRGSRPTGGTDGMQLLSIITGKISADDIHASYFFLRAGLDMEQLKSADGLAATEEGLALYPEHPLLRSNWLAQSLLAERFDGLLPALLDKIEHPSPEPFVQALDLNNLAWSIFRLHQKGRLAETGFTLAQGLEYATWAYAMIPWQPEFEGTYGALLLVTGEAEKAIWHTKAAAKEQTLAENCAANLALAAVGHHRLGQEEQASSLLAQAQALNTDSEQIPWAVGEMEKVTTGDFA